ncbi:hypothetical protein PCASD_06877 [Puccinia coronata f. sp. avenae]|uniref:Uncharacterized protein n=1 Tax=Puccinia coronata f. sp. avenae TaxID=200324 RepID=A0A2N5UYC5_9BASI|nr:hypothetical protein PCASD_06877 [Puccinia coronata f. sp. avenae]
MKVISWYYRLEYGHPSHYSTAKALILSTSLLPLAQEHFPLSPSQLDMLQKLLHWTKSFRMRTLSRLQSHIIALQGCLQPSKYVEWF